MKLKRQCIFLICIFFSLSTKSQDRIADSLKAELVTAKEDTIKVRLLLQLSSYYLDSTPEQARIFGLQALDLAQRLKNNPGRALASKYIGSAYYFLGNTPATLDYFGQSLQIYDSIGDLESKARILNNFGTVYYMNGSDDKALDSYFKSLDVAEKIGDKAGIATAYSNIANIYHNKRATTGKALDFFLKALNISEQIDDKNIIGAVSMNLGEIYKDLNKNDSSLLFYSKSIKAYANTINIPNPLRGVGVVYAKKEDFKNAVHFGELSIQMARKFDTKLALTQSLKSLGDTYYKMNDFQAALAEYQEADSIARLLPAYKELADAYAGQAISYSKIGDFNNAYLYQKKFSELDDTLNNQTLSDKLTSLQKNFEIQTRQNDIDLLTKDKRLQELDLNSQKLQKTIISGGLALILVIALIILRNYLQTNKTNKLLDKQKAQIESLLQNILPAEVAKELQRDGRATPRYYESVSVLFTDFKDFTKHADSLSPQEIVSELNACFIAFDDIIEKYNLEKIKTIGDSYMCAGGIPTENDSHTLNMIHAGHEIQEYMQSRNAARVENGLLAWNLRIGIHVGPVVAGVVGRKKYAYDIWGSTVNIASRMESNGEPGMINISSQTHDLVKHYYNCVHRGKIFAKNIGEIDMFFVDKKIVQPSES
jgi:adenylate cyclase